MTDPREIISKSQMTALQIVVVVLTIGLNALDGLDVLSISFAMPGIETDWGISRTSLGFIGSMELLGMAVGSIFLGGLADQYGRRPTILWCLLVMAVGMFLTTTSQGPITMCTWRILTGLGIGGMLAAINACVAEFSSEKRRHLNVSLMAIGYPIGGFFGGDIVRAYLPVNEDWRSVFYFGFAVTVVFIPLVFFLVPESVHWLARKQPAGALDKINRTLQRLGHQAVNALPQIRQEVAQRGWGDIFSNKLFATTIIVTIAYFFHITTFYFIMKWAPTIAHDMGYTPQQGGGVLQWATGGAIVSGIIFGLLTLKYSVKALTIVVLLFSIAGVTAVGFSPNDLLKLSMLCAVGNFFTNAGVVGLYAIFAHAFPTHARAFGTGFAIGVGRFGAFISPIIVGRLYDLDLGLPAVAFIISLGSLFAIGALIFLKLQPHADSTEEEEKIMDETMTAEYGRSYAGSAGEVEST